MLSWATVRDLGILIDSDVAMRSYVSSTVSGCFAGLRQYDSSAASDLCTVYPTVFHGRVTGYATPRPRCV